jgi:diguanylate cyclase (GGDEF)-like protein
MELDFRMLISVAISSLLMAVVFHVQARSFPSTIRGLDRWSWAMGLVATAMLIQAGRDWLPEMVCIMGYPAALQAALGLLYWGLCDFHGRQPRFWLVALPMALNLLLTGFGLLAGADPRQTVTSNAFSNVLMLLPCLVIVMQGRHGEPRFRFGKLYTGVFMGVSLVLALARGTTIWLTHPVLPAGMNAQIHQVVAVLYPSVMVALTTGLALIAFERLKDELEFLVSHDALTGAFSRRGFLSMAEAEISRALRMGRRTAMLIIDLDHFKQVNDHYGHHVGDLVLVRFADIARSCLRREDLLGRFGGEEFMVLLPETKPQAALVVAERIRTAVLASRVTVPPQHIRFTVSVGVANLSQGGTLEELLKLADKAMYLAKFRGRSL